jgi:hypothetical protein
MEHLPKQQKFRRRNNAGTYKKQVRKTVTAPATNKPTAASVDKAKIVQTSTHVQISFPSKPSEAIRSALKASYWKWSPKLSCWQRIKGWHTVKVANEILKRFQIQPSAQIMAAKSNKGGV